MLTEFVGMAASNMGYCRTAASNMGYHPTDTAASNMGDHSTEGEG